jgi:retinol dehydrogenase-12
MFDGGLYWLAGLTIVGYYFLRKYLQGGKFKKPTRCDGKVILITGANTGIGKETALELSKRGAKIYMACRSKERARKACEEIIEKTGNRNVFVRELDLSSFDSIRKFADE